MSPQRDDNGALSSWIEAVSGHPGEVFALWPSIDVSIDDGRIQFDIELPGVDPTRDVRITVENGSLVIRGMKTSHRPSDTRLVSERVFGRFYRAIPLPEGIDGDSLVAVSRDGVLTVEGAIADRPEVGVRQIPVAVG